MSRHSSVWFCRHTNSLFVLLCIVLLHIAFPFNLSPKEVIVSTTSYHPSITSLSAERAERRRVPNKLPLPFMNLKNIGLSREWKKMYDNLILYPPNQIQPVGVIHFLGGAFFGAAPNILYGSFLEILSRRGFIIVATPFRMNMDYIAICDEVLRKFEPLAVDLAQQYGALPVIGIGHSLGAVLQTLITSLFPDTPRAVNILISYNCRPSTASIPLLQEFVIPFAKQRRFPNASILSTPLVKPFRDLLYSYSNSPISPMFFEEEVIPLFEQTTELIDQIPPLLTQLADGTTSFTPMLHDSREVCRRMYRARKTLLIKFEKDSLDESLSIVDTLKEANTIMRMKRPLIEMQVDLQEIPGNHLTPLVAIPNDRLADINIPALSVFQEMRNMKNLADSILKYLEI